MWCPRNSFKKSCVFYRHAGENRHAEGFENPGFRVAPPRPAPGLPEMTIRFCLELLGPGTGVAVRDGATVQNRKRVAREGGRKRK